LGPIFSCSAALPLRLFFPSGSQVGLPCSLIVALTVNSRE
jgi:hypothetical protein